MAFICINFSFIIVAPQQAHIRYDIRLHDRSRKTVHAAMSACGDELRISHLESWNSSKLAKTLEKYAIRLYKYKCVLCRLDGCCESLEVLVTYSNGPRSV
jgi:hypothetical protein